MKLRLSTPTHVVVNEPVRKIVAEASDGSFCLLPRHADLVAPMVPGLLSLVLLDGNEEYLAVDEGVLVKCGDQVLISTRHAVRGANLGELKQTVHEHYRNLDDKERMTRTATARLEAGFLRRFLELGDPSNG